MNKTPSRILNEKVGFFGLSVFDIGVIGYTLISINVCLRPVGLEILSFPLSAALALGLLSIRLKQRPKIIRDFVAYNLSKQIRGIHGGSIETSRGAGGNGVTRPDGAM